MFIFLLLSTLFFQTNCERTLRVVTIMEKPYLMEKKEGGYQGFVVDLMDKIFQKNAYFEWKLVSDGSYGSYIEDERRWNGMVGALVSNETDIAAAPLTISEEREKVVDFSIPFMHFDIAIVISKNLHENFTKEIKSGADLGKQKEIKYGLMSGGLTEIFFKTASKEPYVSMWKQMNEDRSNVIMRTSDDGIKKVRDTKDGKFVFIMEGPTAKYLSHKSPCNLIVVKGDFNERKYGFAVKKGDILKKEIDEGLKKMKEDGVIDRLEKKWWEEKTECKSSTSFIFSISAINFVLIFFSTFLSKFL